jgi:hypothetical protein
MKIQSSFFMQNFPENGCKTKKVTYVAWGIKLMPSITDKQD